MICVIGDVMLDRTHWVRAARLSAESEGSVIYTADRIEQQLGGAANVAANAFGLSKTVSLIGAIGRDGPGVSVCRMCEELSERPGKLFRYRFVTADETTLKERIRTESTLLMRMDKDGGLPRHGRPWEAYTGSPATATNIEPLYDLATGADQFCLVDYGRGFLQQVFRCKQITSAIQASLRPVVIEPCRAANLHNFKFPRQVFKLNIRQSEEFISAALRVHRPGMDSWRAHSAQDYRSLAYDLHNALVKAGVPYEVVFITLGVGGVIVFCNDNGHYQLVDQRNAAERSVVDVCGAGDTATAVIACALANTATGKGTQWIENAAADLVDWCGRAVSVVGNYVPGN